MTNQRLLILEYLQEDTERHPRAEEIYFAVRRNLPKISFGTVYRNLKKLVDSGIINELHIEKGVSRFDGEIAEHFHFRCRKCKRIFNLRLADSWQIPERASLKTGHRIEKIDLCLSGICKDCLRFVK